MILKAPNYEPAPTGNWMWDRLISKPISIFLAGSIEMGAAIDWQTRLTDYLLNFVDKDLDIYNPRRDDWDSSWEQNLNNPQFYTQVQWELDHLEKADVIAMYFDPSTKSPISLLELGLYAKSGKLVVYCPDEFWRSGNVNIMAQRYGFPVFTDTLTWNVELKRRIHLLKTKA